MPLAPATDETRWDDFVLHNNGGFLHSWGWGEFQKALGRTIWRSKLDIPAGTGDATASETVAQFLLIDHPLPFGFSYLYMPWGPVLGRGDFSTDAATISHERLESVTMTLRAAMHGRTVFCRADFPFLRTGGPIAPNDIEALGFEQVTPVQPADSALIDLLHSEEELLATMHPKTRYNIKVAERHGVTVREADASDPKALEDDITRFWNMLGQTAERDRFHTHPERYYRTMITMLAGKGRSGCTVSLRFAEQNGVAIAAGLFATFGSRITYLHGASLASARKVMAPYALHWQVIRDAKAAGLARYDLWGVAPDDSPEHEWAGITRFKLGFGARRISYLGTWELPNTTFWYTLYRWVRQLRG